MKTNNAKLFLKRVLAYFIDIIIISLLSSTILMAIPENKNYEKTYNKLTELTQQYTNKEITNNQYIKQYNSLQYDLTKYSVNTTIVTMVVTLIYFIAFPLIIEGKTLGKKIMHLKLIPYNDRKLNLFNLVIRTILVANVITNLLTLISVTFMTKSNFTEFNDIINLISASLMIGCGLLAGIRQDGRGLHDLLGGTRVIIDNVEFNEEVGNEEITKSIEEVKNTLEQAKKEVKENKEELIEQSKDLEKTIKEIKKLRKEEKITEAKYTEEKKSKKIKETKNTKKDTKKTTNKKTSKPRIVAKDNK